MSTAEPSLFLYFLAGGIGSAVGYLLRKVQKYEDRRDEIYLKFLPSINNSTSSFIEAIDIFFINSQHLLFIAKIKSIYMNLEEKRLSGEMMFFKETLSYKEIVRKKLLRKSVEENQDVKPNIRKKLSEFSRNLGKFQASLEKKAEEADANVIIKYIIESDEKLDGINQSMLQMQAEEIQEMIESKIRDFKSLYFLLVIVIIIFILGATEAFIKSLV